MEYNNLEQRMAQSRIDLFPDFVPDVDAPVGVDEQKQFHELVKNLYRLAFDEPLLFVPSLHEDDAYPSRFKSAYGKPKLIEDMRKFLKTIDTLLQKMFLLGQGDVVALNKRERVVLTRLGVVDCDNLPAAWVWMSRRAEASLVSFSYCLFKKDYSYAAGVYSRLLGDGAFKKLTDWMCQNGYEVFELHDTTASDCKLSLVVANRGWSQDLPRGGFEYKIRHTGIAVIYDFFVRAPVCLGLCIPNGLKVYLEAFDSMDKRLQSFVVARTKKCDACRYCVQTDKSGSRPLACISIAFEGDDYQLCPYFPGYNYSWTRMDDELADDLIRMLAFMDSFVPDR